MNSSNYTCPMHPEIIQDKPGNCPKCGMNLVPIKQQKEETTAGILYNQGMLLSPAAGAVLMTVSTVVVAINANMLKIKNAIA